MQLRPTLGQNDKVCGLLTETETVYIKIYNQQLSKPCHIIHSQEIKIKSLFYYLQQKYDIRQYNYCKRILLWQIVTKYTLILYIFLEAGTCNTSIAIIFFLLYFDSSKA